MPLTPSRQLLVSYPFQSSGPRNPGCQSPYGCRPVPASFCHLHLRAQFLLSWALTLTQAWFMSTEILLTRALDSRCKTLPLNPRPSVNNTKY